MDTRIEKCIVLGLVRIFSAYGWSGKGAPEHFADKISIIQYGLKHGQALDYLTHLKMLIMAREEDQNWGLFTPVYVKGIASLLEKYAEHNNLFSIEKPKTKRYFNTKVKTKNIFESEDSAALQRLRVFGKTVIRFGAIEEYGEERVLSDLRVYFPKGTVTVDYAHHEPDQISEWVNDDGVERLTIYTPILPMVILATGNEI